MYNVCDWVPFSSQAVLYKGEHTLRGFSDFLERQIQSRVEDEDEVGEAPVPESSRLRRRRVGAVPRQLPESQPPGWAAVPQGTYSTQAGMLP